jgi:hypothetical protein
VDVKLVIAILAILVRWCPNCSGAKYVWVDTTGPCTAVKGEWTRCPTCREAHSILDTLSKRDEK